MIEMATTVWNEFISILPHLVSIRAWTDADFTFGLARAMCNNVPNWVRDFIVR